uniref:Uncharacterized protein n=1 Tax=Aegilops tauschii subsp. strangulata TaxID=200361 RepID=A0A453LDD8_AEGTS
PAGASGTPDGVVGAAEAPRGADQVPRDAPPSVPRRAAPWPRRAVGVRGARAWDQGLQALARHLQHGRDGGARARRRCARAHRPRRLPQLRRLRMAHAARARGRVVRFRQRERDQGRRRRGRRRVPAEADYSGRRRRRGAPAAQQIILPVACLAPEFYMSSGDLLELDEEQWFGGMDAGSYYASLAQGMLVAPPDERARPEHGEQSGVQTPLWSY